DATLVPIASFLRLFATFPPRSGPIASFLRLFTTFPPRSSPIASFLRLFTTFPPRSGPIAAILRLFPQCQHSPPQKGFKFHFPWHMTSQVIAVFLVIPHPSTVGCSRRMNNFFHYESFRELPRRVFRDPQQFRHVMNRKR